MDLNLSDEHSIARVDSNENLANSNEGLVLRSDIALSKRKRIVQDFRNFYQTYPFKILIFAYFGWMFDFYDLALFGFLKDAVAKDLHIDENGVSWLLGLALGTSGLGGFIAGPLADKFGKRLLLQISIFIYSLGSLICGLSFHSSMFFIGRTIVGLGVGGEWALGHAMLAENVSPEQRGRSAAFLQSGEPVGVMLAALVGYVIMPKVGWRAVLITSSLTAVLSLIGRFVLPLDQKITGESKTSLLTYVKQNTTVKERIKLAKYFFLSSILSTLKLATYWSLYTWLPSFLLNEMHQGVGKSIAWILTGQIGQFVGMQTFGIVADKLGRRPGFSIYSIITAIGIVPLAYFWNSVTPAIFWVSMLINGIGGGCVAGLGAINSELFPTEIRLTCMGGVYGFARLSQLLIPRIVSVSADHFGLKGGLSVPIAFAVLTAIWVWTLPETKGIVLTTLKDSSINVEMADSQNRGLLAENENSEKG